MKETSYTITVTTEDNEVVHQGTVTIMDTDTTWEQYEERLMDGDIGEYVLMSEMEWPKELGPLGEDIGESIRHDYNQIAGN